MNLREMGELIGLEGDEFIEIVELFITTAASDIEKLKAAKSSRDATAAAEAAHSIKGSAGNLGFTEMAEISAELETSAHEQNMEPLDTAIPLLTQKLEEIKKAL